MTRRLSREFCLEPGTWLMPGVFLVVPGGGQVEERRAERRSSAGERECVAAGGGAGGWPHLSPMCLSWSRWWCTRRGRGRWSRRGWTRWPGAVRGGQMGRVARCALAWL